MRRLSLILLVALCAVPAAALAARTTAGDGVFELRTANGSFTLVGRGVLWGQMDKGALRVASIVPDPAATTQPLAVSGNGLRQGKALDDPTVTVYTGTNLHFRVTGGKYKLRFKGSGLDLTAIGVGSSFLVGSPNSLDPGDYAIDGGKWLPIAWTDRLLTFGIQPPPPGQPPTTGP